MAQSNTGYKSKYITLLVLALMAAFSPLFQGNFYAIGDMRDVFIPLEHFFQQETLNARLPSWNPDIAWGFPTIASAQIGFFYPPLLLLRLLPLQLYFPIILLGHFIAQAIGSYLFLRALNISRPASYFGSLSFTLGSFFIQHVSQLNIIITAAWFPWQLLLIHKVTAKKKLTLRHLAPLALIFGLPFLAGQLHIPAMIAIVSAAYFLYRCWEQHRKVIKPITKLLAIALVALLIAAAQLLPTFELAAQSSRGPSGDFNLEQANQHSFPLYHLPTLLFPRFYGNDDTYWGKRLQVEYGFFIGTIPIMLALWYLTSATRETLGKRIFWSPRPGPPPMAEARWPKPRSRRWGDENELTESSYEVSVNKRFFHWLLVISFLLSLGSLSPFRLLGFEPSLWIFSAPARWLLFTTFALALFAAKGLDQLTKQQRSFQRFSATIAVIVFVTTIIGTALLFTIDADHLNNLATSSLWGNLNRSEAYYTAKLDSLLSSARTSSISLASPFTALPIILIGALPFLLRRKRAIPIILIVTTLELVILATTANPVIPWSIILAPPDTVSVLPASVLNKQARIISLRQSGDTGQYFTNPETRANYERRREYRQLLIPLGHTVFNIPGVEWPASLDLAHHAEKLDQFRDAENLRFIDSQLAEQLNIGAVLIKTGSEIEIYNLTPAPRASTSGQATYLAISPTRTRITVNSITPANLTVRDSFYPGWRAYIDGQPAPINQTDSIFRAVKLNKGKHIVDMVYVPVTLYTGIAISSTALVLCLLVIYKKRV